MIKVKLALAVVAAAVGLSGLSVYLNVSFAQTKAAEPLASYKWSLPKGFPTPAVPAGNPMSEAKVELGRYLFYDTRLSINEKSSCATCHQQDQAFTDGRKQAIGTTGEIHPRNSMSLVNIAYMPSLNWANPTVIHLENQALVPIFGESPVELGMSGKEDLLIRRIKAEPRYRQLFNDAYPGEQQNGTLNRITQALASFVRSLISGNSPYDQYRLQGNASAISESAKRGERLFFSERMECFDCHAGFNLSGTVNFVGKGVENAQFENNGLYNIDGKGGFPKNNTGIFEFTRRTDDMGKFKVPSLRNVELTAPYMHDGSIATLEEVIDHYQAGGRTIKEGEYAGRGSDNPYKSSFVRGFDLSVNEKRDLIAFLRSLTDLEFVNNPKFSDPWTK